jgi:uncharacterized phage protein gp47/JayE
VKPQSPLLLHGRRRADVIAALVARRPGFVEAWLPPDTGPGAALIHAHALFVETIIDRLNQAPEKNKLAFLSVMGIECTPAQPARAPVVFQLGDDAPAVTLPAGAQVAAPPAPETSDQIVFETERIVGLSPARLVEVRSLWPGRDQYADHTAKHEAKASFRVLNRPDLEDIPHVLYLAHDGLLALTGRVALDVDIDLAQPSNAEVAVIWEYWDGGIWRRFADQVPDCRELMVRHVDGTKGLTRSGRFRLTADCAESAKIAVDGVEAFWIRGRLNQTLPVDPRRILPEIDSVKLTATIERPLAILVGEATEAYLTATVAGGPADPNLGVAVTVTDATGAPVAGAVVNLVDSGHWAETGSDGSAHFSFPAVSGFPGTVDVTLLDVTVTHRLTGDPHPGANRLSLELRLEIVGLLPDSIFSDATKLDPTRPYFPFGQQPQPGSTFYLACAEAFSKPGARVNLHRITAATIQDSFDASGTTSIDNRLVWEYWNGRRWAPLAIEVEGGSLEDLPPHGTISFRVPQDMAATKVNDENGWWIRVGLASGTFGFVKTVTFGENGDSFAFAVVQPPALSDLRISYTWENGPHPPDRVITFNDFLYSNKTDAARWPGSAFRPYEPPSDATQSLVLGFDRKLPVDRLTLLFDVVEEPGAAQPELVWEYWAGLNWRPLVVEDETRNLRHPGIVSFVAPDDAASLARFGEPRYWLRARVKAVGLPFSPEIRRIHTNASWATQRQTIVNEVLGRSTGLPNQHFGFRRFPVLPDEHVEVRELSGARANVEWRLVAAEVAGDAGIIDRLEGLIGEEGTEADVVVGDLRLRRDRNKRVSELFVRWYPRRRMFGATATERAYVLDRATGKMRFGDGVRGKIPPLGADIVARSYHAGGGAAGNVAAGAITQLLAGAAGIDAVINPLAAEGGSDVEMLEAVARRGPRTLAHRGRAVNASSYETLARESSPAVAAAYARPTRDPQGIMRPGWVSLVIVPNGDAPRPQPSFGLREHIRRYIGERMAGDVEADDGLHVTGPLYQEIDVDALVVPIDMTLAGVVVAGVRRALERFLHPLLGGPERRGWQPGQSVYVSDLAAVLASVEGLDHVRELVFLRDGRPLGEVAAVGEERIVVAGAVRVRVAG